MADSSVQIYLNNDVKYCSGCLHTEDATKLYNMQTYGWVFTDLFTKLYLTDELKASFICIWCVRRLDNARKLFENFQQAQYILARIADNLFSTQELKQDLSSRISNLKIKSRLQICDIKNEPDVLEIKIEDIDYVDSENDIDDNFEADINTDYLDESNLYTRSLRSNNGENNTNKKRKYLLHNKRITSGHSKSKVERDIRRHKKRKTTSTLKGDRSKVKPSLRDKDSDISKCEDGEMRIRNQDIITKDSKIAIENEKSKLHDESVIPDTDDISLSDVKSIIKTEDSNSYHINTNTKADQNKLKPGKRKTKTSRGYLPHLPRIPCTECDRLFIKKIALDNHMIHNHKKKYPCDKCDRVFTKEECLKIHIAKVHEPRSGIFECAICGTIYKHRVKMVEHMIRHQKYGPSLKDLNSIVCHHCGKVCSRKSIKTHLITHSDEKPYHCSVCSTYFKGALALENHMKRNHNPDIGKQFVCPHCPKKFYLSSDVRCHVHAVHFVKNHICLVCSKSFGTASKLREHVLRVHEKVPAVRNKQCEYCDKAFSTNRQLKHHRYTHTGEKPYKCHLCTSAYNQKHCLVMHKLRAHNIEKPTREDNIVENIAGETVTKNIKTQGLCDNVAGWYSALNDVGNAVK